MSDDAPTFPTSAVPPERAGGTGPAVDSDRDRYAREGWFALGASLLVGCTVVSLLSGEFVHGERYLERPILEVVVLLLAGGALYLVAALRCRERAPTLRFVIIVSVLARALLLLGQPIQEDDFYRYLWDGRVASTGVSSYRFSPAEVDEVRLRPDAAAAEDRVPLVRLSELSEQTPALATGFERINNREYATIYPPLAQIVFRAGASIIPVEWDIAHQVRALRALIVLFDLGIFFAVVALLRSAGRPPGWALLYGWCPLVLKEFSNSGHMDAIPGFFLAWSLVALLSRCGVFCGILLGAAIAAKFYAAALLPLAFVRLGVRRGGLAVATAIALIVLVNATSDSGLRYRETLVEFTFLWEKNSALFAWMQSIAGTLAGTELVDLAIPLARGHAPLDVAVPIDRLIALGAAGALLALITVLSARGARRVTRPEVLRRAFVVLASVFLIGPLGFPWYFTWCVPLLAFVRARSWFVLPGLLSLYYVFFWVIYHHEESWLGFTPGDEFFHRAVVALEFGAFFASLAYEAWRTRRGSYSRERDFSM